MTGKNPGIASRSHQHTCTRMQLRTHNNLTISICAHSILVSDRHSWACLLNSSWLIIVIGRKKRPLWLICPFLWLGAEALLAEELDSYSQIDKYICIKVCVCVSICVRAHMCVVVWWYLKLSCQQEKFAFAHECVRLHTSVHTYI